MKSFFVLAVVTVLCYGCSLPPAVPVTRDDLMGSYVYQMYIIEESPEEVLDALNLDGEVMLKTQRKVGSKTYPVWLKILATPSGLDIGDYDR